MRIGRVIRWSMILGVLLGLVVLLAPDANAVEKDKPKQATIGDLDCTQEGAIAKIVGGQWVCESDTNAGTICTGGQVLNGDGQCVDQTVDTNTNAATECGTGEVLDGDGNCVDLLRVVTTQCPCKFELLLFPAPNQSQMYWLEANVVQNWVMKDVPKWEMCVIGEDVFNGDTIIVNVVGGSFEDIGTTEFVTAICGVSRNGVSEEVDITSPDQAFACAKDINDYALKLAANGVTVNVLDTCREAPAP